eukprot:754809-Hanusia_phi.AAC.6
MRLSLLAQNPSVAGRADALAAVVQQAISPDAGADTTASVPTIQRLASPLLPSHICLPLGLATSDVGRSSYPHQQPRARVCQLHIAPDLLTNTSSRDDLHPTALAAVRIE